MKKLVLALSILLSSMAPFMAKGQVFTPQHDTVFATVSGSSAIFDYLTNNQDTSIVLKWRVIASDFPSDWIAPYPFGVCDNFNCYTNTQGNSSLWNGTLGSTQISHPYAPGGNGTFDLALNFQSVSAGTHYVSVELTHAASGYSKIITFVISKFPTSVANVSNNDEVTLYPNPAASSVNVVYSADAGIKLAAVYNMIGKVMLVNKVSGNSANINLENVPAGTYFIRLIDGNGSVIATRKFTRQQ